MPCLILVLYTPHSLLSLSPSLSLSLSLSPNNDGTDIHFNKIHITTLERFLIQAVLGHQIEKSSRSTIEHSDQDFFLFCAIGVAYEQIVAIGN